MSLLSVLTLIALTPSAPSHAACAPLGTNAGDTITCTSNDTQGVDARAGADSVTVQAGASVPVNVSDSSATVTAIEGGKGNDTVTNSGSVSAGTTKTQAQSPTVPMPSTGTAVFSTDNHVSTTAVAIDGGRGNDRIDNLNTANAGASTTATNVSVPLTILGGDTVTATTTIDANTTGLKGGGRSNDTVNNSGTVEATSSAQITHINVEHNFVDTSHGNANTTLTATAVGVSGGERSASSASNTGTIDAAASARALGVNVEMNGVDAATADAVLSVNAVASGMQSGAHGGTLANDGGISAAAATQVLDVGVNASYADLTIADRKVSNAGTTLQSTATGIDGSRSTGSVAMANTGSINATAGSDVHAISIALASEGVPSSTEPVFSGLASEAGIASIGVTATSTANGAVGGSGDDNITNSGTIDANAGAGARQESINVGISLIDWKIPTPGIVIGSAGTGSTAHAVGVDGGAGNDAVSNDNRVTATANANASALTVSANISGFTDNALGGGSIPGLGSLGASLSVADTMTQATAAAAALRGGDGDDMLQNRAVVEANANADSGSISVSASVNVKYKEGENLIAANAVAARALTTSDASATGVDGGAGNDTIANTGSVTTNAEADAHNVSVAVTVGGTVRAAGGGVNLAATDTSGIATATATGIDGGAGNDAIVNSGLVQSAASAEASSVSAAASIGFAKQGAVADVSLARAQSAATATAVGLDGGDGDDAITNTGALDTHADADAKAISVSVSVSATADGVSISGALVKADAQATAQATGIAGGAGNDTLVNQHSITTHNVESDATAAGISVSIAGTNNGVAAGVSLADTSAHANSSAQGIQGGAGDDNLQNTDTLLLQQVSADANAASVSVSMNAALNAGVAAGGAMATASAEANAGAVGMDGGDGNDLLTNSGTIRTQDIQANAGAVSVAVAANLSMTGAAVGATYVDTSATATTTVKGMAGGAGDDAITNSGTLDMHGRADVAASSIGVSISAAAGVGGGAELVKAGSTATSITMGIDGGSGRNDIANTGSINATADADAQALSIGVGVTLAFGGDATLTDAKTTATATAVGINDAGEAQAGTGNIDNAGAITATANATSHGTSISGNLRGFALGATTNSATAEAYGIRSGDNASVIHNAGTLSVAGSAEASGLSIAATLAGKAVGNADTVADGRSTGISAGGGDDRIENDAAITATASTGAGAITFSVDLAGSADASVRTLSTATASGIDGGDGADTLTNRSTIAAHADAGTFAAGVSISIAGTAHGDASTTPVATASGLSGGAGDDTITHLGDLDVSANAHASILNVSWTLAGTNGNDAGVDARAVGVGIDAGDGNDTVLNQSNLLRVTATAHTQLDSSSWAFAGRSNDDGTLAAGANASGIVGGSGADTLRNETALSATAQATLDAVGGGNAIFGNAGSSVDVGATATAVGIDAGADSDTVTNLGALTVAAESTVNSTRTAFSFAGTANIDELLKSTSRATGIDAGDGDNVVYNNAAINVTATAAATTNGSARADLGGGTSASGSASADAGAIGIAAGAGNDRIENAGAITVSAIVAPVANNSSSAGTFFGDGEVQGRVVGTVHAVGIDAGDGNNDVTNNGSLVVNAFTRQDIFLQSAQANTFASGSDFSFFTQGTGRGRSETTLTADAAGIRAGDGNNTVVSSGAIAVNVDRTFAGTFTDPNGGTTGGYGFGNSISSVTATGSGILLGNGDNVVHNTGTIDVHVSPRALAGTDADGSFDKSADGFSSATAIADARGMRLGEGHHHIVNDGAIRVIATPWADSWADADGGHLDGNGTAVSVNVARADAVGISVGSGGSAIENNALIAVSASAVTQPSYTGRGPAINAISIGYESGDADSNVYAEARSSAAGIVAGDGAHTIVNNDTISVVADPFASGGYITDAGSLSSGHNNARLVMFAPATAKGIVVGNGDSMIVNRGTISAEAIPTASSAFTGGDGGPYIQTETQANAVGIQGGSGNQTVVNSGQITAIAQGFVVINNDGGSVDLSARLGASPTAFGISLTGTGRKDIVNSGTIDVQLISNGLPLSPFDGALVGIATGNDGDRIVNNGTLTTTRNVNGFVMTGTAIDTGAGDDVVQLGDGSVTRGDINLGLGNDTLVLNGTPIMTGSVFHADPIFGGSFSLELNNAGNFANALPTVTNVTKNGAGTYTLPTLNTLQHLTVNQGTLSIASNYQFSHTGVFQTNIYHDGSNGSFNVAGVATLDGTLQIARDQGSYRNGQSFDVLTAGTVAGGSTFSSVELPQATALLSFNSEVLADRVRVVADAASFTTVATGAEQNTVARRLDVLLPTATGDLSDALGQIQNISSGRQFAAALHSLSPGVYNGYSLAGFGNVSRNIDVMRERLLGLQVDNLTGTASGAETVRLAYDGNSLGKLLDIRDAEQARASGVWIRGFSQKGDQDTADPLSRFEYSLNGAAIGYDTALNRNLSVGLAVSDVGNRVHGTLSPDDGRIDSTLWSGYVGYFSENLYVNGTLTFGRNRYDSHRDLVIGGTTTPVASRHDGDVLAASVGGGYYGRGEKWRAGPFADLQYTRIKEERFAETGSGAALAIGARATSTLISTLGVRAIGLFDASSGGKWIPELSLAWVHDYAIDGSAISASYADAPDAVFTLSGPGIDRNGALLGLGISYRTQNGIVGSLKYNAESRGDFSAGGFVGELRYEF